MTLFSVENGIATRVNDLASGEAAQGIVFTKGNKTILVQFDVEKPVAVYQIQGGKLTAPALDSI